MSDPVSWLVIEPGWAVVGSDGAELGRIDELVGDTGRDIFDGLVVSAGLLRKRRYVPAERVTEIVEGRVTLALGADEFERLEDHEEPPPSERFLAP